MILLAVVTSAARGSAPPIDLRIDVIEGRSIADLADGEVLHESELTLPSDGTFEHRFTEPATGHEYRVTVELVSTGDASSTSDLVAVKVRIEDLATGEAAFQHDHLAIDGRMLLALHPVPGTDREVFLSLVPRIRRGEAP